MNLNFILKEKYVHKIKMRYMNMYISHLYTRFSFINQINSPCLQLFGGWGVACIAR